MLNLLRLLRYSLQYCLTFKAILLLAREFLGGRYIEVESKDSTGSRAKISDRSNVSMALSVYLLMRILRVFLALALALFIVLIFVVLVLFVLVA